MLLEKGICLFFIENQSLGLALIYCMVLFYSWFMLSLVLGCKKQEANRMKFGVCEDSWLFAENLRRLKYLQKIQNEIFTNKENKLLTVCFP